MEALRNSSSESGHVVSFLWIFTSSDFQPLDFIYRYSHLVSSPMILLNFSAVFSSSTKMMTTLLLLQLSLLSSQLGISFICLLAACIVAFVVFLSTAWLTTTIILLHLPLLCFFCCFFLHVTFSTHGIKGGEDKLLWLTVATPGEAAWGVVPK